MQQKKKINDFRSLIFNWNKKYPLDLWWRSKYNIPFGSEQHKGISFVEMRLDFEEQRLLNESQEETKDVKYSTGNKQVDEIANLPDDPKTVKMSKDELDYEFDNLDLSKFNTSNKPNGH